jgi:two-component system, chemotaxis family, chemotaxis protein CheY
MLVDDSSMSAKQLEQIIHEVEGFEVIARAKNGAEALKLFAAHRPNVVCMDIVMPVMDGLTALRSLLQLDPSVAVLMVSSVGGSRDKAIEALRLGAKNVLSKPFDAASIRAALEAL